MTMSKNQELFAEWLAVPKKKREPKTQKELAAKLNICSDTLSRWKKDLGLRTLVYDMARTRLEAELPDIMQVIIDKAKEGHFHFAKLALELTDRYCNRIAVESEEPKVGIEQYLLL